MTTPNTMMWTRCLVFIIIQTSCKDRASQLSLPFDPGRNFSYMRQTEVCSILWGGDAWVCWKVSQHNLFSCPSWPVIRIDPFSFCLRNTKCLRAVPDWKETHSHISGPNWFAGTVVNHCLDLTKKFESSFLNRMISEAFKQLYLHNYYWTHQTFFFYPLYCLHIETQTLKSSYWCFQYECIAGSACCCQISGRVNYVMLLLSLQIVPN